MSFTHDTPVGLQGWQERILHAYHHGEALALRGLQTKDFFTRHRLQQPLSVLSTAGLGASIEHEPSELYVRVQSAASLSMVEEVLDQAGQCLAFEPPRFLLKDSPSVANASIGGMVASGLSGPARVSAGSLRDHVLGVSLINGRGEYLQFGGQVMKNVAGYDVSRLLCGSWGMLGLITEVTFKVLPKAPCEQSIQVRASQSQALALLAQWGTRAWPLNASVWAPPSHDGHHFSDPRHHDQESGTWTLRFRGAAASVKASVESLHAEFKRLGLVSLELTAMQAQTLWSSVKDQTHGFFVSPPGVDSSAENASSFNVLWRLSLPLTQQHNTQALPSSPQAFMEWHGALRWFWAPLSQGLALRQEAATIGAQLTLWKTPPCLEAQALASSLTSSATAALLRPALSHASAKLNTQIQQAFDPKGVFYNGCLF